MRRCPRLLRSLTLSTVTTNFPFANTSNRRCFPASRPAKAIESKILVCYPATGLRQSRFRFSNGVPQRGQKLESSATLDHILDKPYEQFNSLACSSPDAFASNQSEIAHCGGIFGAFLGGFFKLFFGKSIARASNSEGGDDEMKSSSVTILLLSLISPVFSDAQEIYRSTRSLEEQQAISQIGQAEYYARMALRSLEASEKIGKAPYFNYQSAREDIEKVLAEFKTYLKGDESTDLPPAVPLIVDGRYFAESIKNFLATRKTEEGQAASNLPRRAVIRVRWYRSRRLKTRRRHQSRAPPKKHQRSCHKTRQPFFRRPCSHLKAARRSEIRLRRF